MPSTRIHVAALVALALLAASVLPIDAHAIGEESLFDVRAIDYTGGHAAPRPSAPRRLGWEIRMRTSVETRLEPTRSRLSDPAIFNTPFLYWSGDEAFEPLSVSETDGLRRFVELGGFVLIDDASGGTGAFDSSVRREIARAFPSLPLETMPGDHTLYRAFYLVHRPVGRIEGPGHVEMMEQGGRTAIVYSRHDLGGAWARDSLGNWEQPVTPGGESQRELAIRLGVNAALYALCLDYKDDQVHAPFLMRRGGLP